MNTVLCELNINLNFAEKIRIAREKNRLTQEQLAKLCGLSKNTIYNYEKGIFKPTAENLYIISKMTYIPIEQFYE